MASYGIDLGTSNCLVARVTENLDGTFDVKCLSDEEGNESFPSIVYFKDENSYQIGESAASKLYDFPDSTIELIKIRLGKASTIPVSINNTSVHKSPQEISSLLLKHFNCLHDNKITDAVLTVPAFFDQGQKDATMQAGALADIKISEMIEEPTAAIMYHLFYQYKTNGIDWFKVNQNSNILVFDFGGGTLDLSLIGINYENEQVKPAVLCVGGDNELGGNIIDFIFTKKIITYLEEQYVNDEFIQKVSFAYSSYYSNYIKHNKMRFDDGVTRDVKQFIFRLKRNLENVKIKLSSLDSVKIVFERNYSPITITRGNFEEMVLMDDEINIKERIQAALDGISKKRIPVNQVLLIGGSSQIPLLRQIIKDVFEEMSISEEKIVISNDYDKAVAKGAAILVAISEGKSIPPFMLNRCRSIVSRDIEIEHAGKKQIFVEMGSEYPFKAKKEFGLKIGHALSESVQLKFNETIIDSDGEIAKKQICQFSFFLPIYYTGDEIKVSMQINEAGLYQIEAIHMDSQEHVEYEPEREFSLSDREMERVTEKIKQMKDII